MSTNHQPFTRQRTVSDMRELADAFVRGMGAHVRSGSALTCTEHVARSYAEPIAVFDPDRPGTLLITSARFSVTTSKHTGIVRRAAEARGVPVEPVEHDRLRELAR